MVVTRGNVEKTKAFIRERIGNPYVYGGALSLDKSRGTDCSEVWQTVLEMALGRWVQGRQSEGATTESYRYIPIGGVGPFGTIRVASPRDIPVNAVAKLAFHHGPGGGANSHMWGELDGMRIESGGSKGLVTGSQALAIDNPYATAWAYLPGPIAGGEASQVVVEAPDTLYADVSEWQRPVDDSYPHRVLCIRSNDGNHRDRNWAANFAWCKKAADDGRLTCFIVYYYWRPGVDSVSVLQDMVGVPHPKMAVMIDVESGGNPRGDFSASLNADNERLAKWLGSEKRVIAYGNSGDLKALWPTRREDQLVVAGYGSNPNFPGQIAHQYTDGQGYGGGLPEGCPPFGNCDMNAANGYTATAFAAALGIETAQTDPLEELLMLSVPSLSIYANPGEPDVPVSAMIQALDAHGPHEPYVEKQARLGDPDALFRVARTAAGKGQYGKAVGPVNQAVEVLAEISGKTKDEIRAELQKGSAA